MGLFANEYLGTTYLGESAVGYTTADFSYLPYFENNKASVAALTSNNIQNSDSSNLLSFNTIFNNQNTTFEEAFNETLACKDLPKPTTPDTVQGLTTAEKKAVQDALSKEKEAAAAKKKVSLDYVTGSQARIYISGILLDEIYDLQYTYRESKEPIYGYNSKHFDVIADGNVVIYGSFTINYRHDGYLYSILSKTREKNIAEGESRIDTLKNNKDKYRNLINAYQEKQTSIKNLNNSLSAANGVLDSLNNDLKVQERAYLTKTEDINEKLYTNLNSTDNFLMSIGDPATEEGQQALQELNDKVQNFENAIKLVDALKQQKTKIITEENLNISKINATKDALAYKINISNEKITQYDTMLTKSGETSTYKSLVSNTGSTVFFDAESLAPSTNVITKAAEKYPEGTTKDQEYNNLINILDANYTTFNGEAFSTMSNHIKNGDDVYVISPRNIGTNTISSNTLAWAKTNAGIQDSQLQSTPAMTYKSWLSKATGIPTSKIIFNPKNLSTTLSALNADIYYSSDTARLNEANSAGATPVTL